MKIDKGLIEPITKLIDVIARGTGVLYEPRRIKKLYKAKASGIKEIENAICESKLPTKYNDGELCIEKTALDFLERSERRNLFQEAKKQKNIEDIIVGTYHNLESEDMVSGELPQEEWIDRFFNIAGEVSSNDLKIIWSRILSEEIKNPGKYTIRTLETLRNVSRAEALKFKKISDYIIEYGGVYYLPCDEFILNEFEISYADILQLDEAGLINAFNTVRAKFNFNDVKEPFLKYNDKIILCNKKEKNMIDLNIYPLTSVGENIFNILSPNFDGEYFEKFMNLLKNVMEVSYSTIIEILPDGSVKYKTPTQKV